MLRAQRRTGFWLLLMLLLGLIAVRYAFQIDIPKFLFAIIVLCMALVGDKSEIIAVCICCIPLHESIDLFYSVVFAVGAYVIKYFRQLRIGVSIALILSMIAWELLHCLRSEFSPVAFLTSVIPLVVLAVMMYSDLSDLDYPFVVRAFSAATLGICLTLLVKVLYLSGFNILSAIAGLQRLGVDTNEANQSVTIEGGQVNPNTLGIISVLAVTGLMQIRHKNQGRKTDIVIACVLMVFGALTASRTYLACLALMVVLLIFAQEGSLNRKLRFLGMILVLAAAALGLLYLLFPELLTYYIGRFFVRDITTGRMELMELYHDFIVSRPWVLLFGIGLKDYGATLVEVYRIAWVVPHNCIQEIIIAWGVPGLLFFAALFACMYHAAGLSRRPLRLINAIPLLIILFKGMAGQLLTSPYTMLALSVVYLSLHADLRPSIFPRTGSPSGCDIKYKRRNTNQ